MPQAIEQARGQIGNAAAAAASDGLVGAQIDGNVVLHRPVDPSRRRADQNGGRGRGGQQPPVHRQTGNANSRRCCSVIVVIIVVVVVHQELVDHQGLLLASRSTRHVVTLELPQQQFGGNGMNGVHVTIFVARGCHGNQGCGIFVFVLLQHCMVVVETLGATRSPRRDWPFVPPNSPCSSRTTRTAETTATTTNYHPAHAPPRSSSARRATVPPRPPRACHHRLNCAGAVP